MRSATSYFKISGAVIRDDFRRFWAIPVIGFIYYFFSSIFFILMSMRESAGEFNNDAMANFISNLLDGGYWMNIGNIIWMSVLSVLLVFRYLHISGHAIAVHSQPFTRSTLLNSHTLSCIMFIAIPIVLTGIILLMIAHPVYYSSYYYSSSDEMVDLFARANVLKWMWQSFLTGMFIMVISIAAGMVTGTSFHHAIAALGFNAVAPICTLLLAQYFHTYLFGYVSSDWLEEAIVHMSPVINTFEDGYLSAGENVFYIVIVILIYALAMFLYSKRKLERATDGIVFKAVDVLITLIFGYLGMTALGLAFYSIFSESKGAVTFGYIAGAVLGIIIVRMIIMKTVRVFNKKTAVIMGVYLVIALAFFGCLNFNITGYESRIEDNADAVTVSFENSGSDLLLNGGTFEDEASVNAIKDLHRYIIENKKLIKEINESNDFEDDNKLYEDTMRVSFDYEKKDGDRYKTLQSRAYNVPVYLVLNSDAMKSLADAGTLNKNALSELPKAEQVQYADIRSGSYYSGTPYGADANDYDMICSDKTQLAGLMEAIKKDIGSMTYDEMKKSYNMPTVASIELEYAVDSSSVSAPDELMNVDQSSQMQSRESKLAIRTTDMTIDLTSSYRNTIAWLNDNGYGTMTNYNDSYWNFAVVYDVEGGTVTAGELSDTYSMSDIPKSSEGMNVVTDPGTIKNIFNNISSHVAIGALADMSTSENGIYMVKFYHRGSEYDGYYAELTAYIDSSHYYEATEANEQ